MSKIKTLIVDDSVVNRRNMINALSDNFEFEIVGFAADGSLGFNKFILNSPHVVLLDLNMPEFGGIEMLKNIRKADKKVIVIMLGEADESDEAHTLEVLSHGANDYAIKPLSMSNAEDAGKFMNTIVIPMIKQHLSIAEFSHNNKESSNYADALKMVDETKKEESSSLDILAIGVSTGGPKALETLLSGFHGKIDVPVLIVQHMPASFTKLLAERLSCETGLCVTEGISGEAVKKGKIYVAPGDYHMCVRREGSCVSIILNQDPPENSCRPAVDVLFRSVAQIYGNKTLSVILTGMGQDGLIGCEHIKKVGGQIIVQDMSTSVVWGMPGAVAQAGLADAILPVGEIAAEIEKRILIFRKLSA